MNSARETMIANMGTDPYAGIEALRLAGRRKAKAEGIAYQMQEMRKVLLSRISGEIAQVKSNESLSEVKLERIARGDPRYQKHLEETAAAITEQAEAVSEYFAIKSELEWDSHSLFHLNAISKLDR